MINLVVLISFFLDGLLSIFSEVTIFSLFSFKPLFTVVSLMLIYPFYNKYPVTYYKICLITGLAYDLLYTDTLLLNTLLFLFIGFIISKIYSRLSDGFISTLFIVLITTTLYHVLTFFILTLIGYLPFDLITFSYDFISVIITNLFFFIVIYCFIKPIKTSPKRKSKYSL